MSEEKTGIFVKIRFWTDFTSEDGEKTYYKKKAWAAGTLYLEASKFHEIKSSRPIPFNNMEEFFIKLDKLLRENGITLVIKDESGNLVPRLGKGYPKGTWSGHD
ncbi:MAG: hypothetical protein ACP6IU_11755 [Candidatus Asgardarchaeia archaeon]